MFHVFRLVLMFYRYEDNGSDGNRMHHVAKDTHSNFQYGTKIIVKYGSQSSGPNELMGSYTCISNCTYKKELVL